MGRTTITRRRALALGAAAGLGSLLAGVPNALARRGATARGFALRVGPADFAGGGVSRPLAAPRRFDLLGVRGAASPLQVRVRRAGGAWSRWVPLAGHGDHAPDTGSGERASDPVWAGGADELQLRAARPLRAALHVHLVAVPAAARRRATRRARAAARPSQATQPPGTPPSIIPRAAWGGDGVPPREDPSYAEVQLAFVHHTVTANGYGPEDSAAIVLGIAKYHRDANGWNDIGYNFLVDQYGQVFEGRAGGVDQAVVGAQAQGYNRVSTGIALLGTHESLAIPEPAIAVIAQLIGWKLPLHGVPVEGQVTVFSGGGDSNHYPSGTPVVLQRISGHRDGDKTSCPGQALYDQLPELRRRAALQAGPLAGRAEVTLQPAAETVPYGDEARFGGQVRRADGQPAAGEPVSLQKRGSTGWVTVARAPADATGAWSAGVAWKRGGDVRARAGGGTSKIATVGLLPKLDAKAAAPRVLAGRSAVVTGRVQPASLVEVVVHKQGTDGGFHRVGVARARVRRAGAYRAAVRLRRPGLYRLTSRTSARAGAAKAPPVFVRAVRDAAKL